MRAPLVGERAGPRSDDSTPSRWQVVYRVTSDDVYRHLLKRVVLAARARAVKKQPAHRPTIVIGRITASEPRDGALEAVVMVHSRGRSRAVAIRLEGMDNRWRASAIHVL
jgi:hypothetical protein